jgi:hypothetical protein
VNLSLAGPALLLVAAAVGFGAASPAGADCAGPTFRHDLGPVDRGGPLLVEGLAFGDNCYDTGPPPEGQGVLGKPRSDISVFVVQDGEEHLVAEGSADDDYGFAVEVPVPAGLDPGEADVVVRLPDGFEAYDQEALPFTVSDAVPADGVPADVATFGPEAEESEVVQVPGEGDGDGEGGGEVVSRGGEGGDPPIAPFVVSGVVLLAAIAVALVLRSRRPTGDDPTG